MKKSVLTFLLLPFIVLGAFLFIIPNNIFALVPATVTPTNPGGDTSLIDENTIQLKVEFKGLAPSTNFRFCLSSTKLDCVAQIAASTYTKTSDASGTVTIDNLCGAGETDLKIVSGGCGASDYFWGNHTYSVALSRDTDPALIGQALIPVQRYIPTFDLTSDNGFRPGSNITIEIKGSRRPKTDTDRNAYKAIIKGSPDPTNNQHNFSVTNDADFTYPFTSLGLNAGDYTTSLIGQNNNSDGFVFGTISFKIDPAGGLITSRTGGTAGAGAGNNPCTVGPGGTGGQCETALGNIPTSVKGFAEKILAVSTGIAGGIALILMVIGSVRVLASSGDPKAVGAGREMIVAAVAGLLFLIFAVLILRFIGVNILGGVPGMGP